jgi:hypothetical protein
MSATSAPRVKKAILEKLEAESSLSGVQIAYSDPGATTQQEVIYFDKTTSKELAAALGRKRRDEDYDLELVVGVAQDGDFAQVCEERCWEIVAIVENMVRLNPEMPSTAEPTGTVSGWVVFAGAVLTPYITTSGQRIAATVCTIHVKHRK